MKLGAKRAELVQKFVPRSRVGIFCNERTRSTPLDPKLMFWYVCTIWVHLGPFGCVTKLSVKRAELVPKFVPRCRVRIFRNEYIRSFPVDPKLMFWCVLYYLGCIWYRLVALQNSVQNGLKWCKISCHEVVSDFATNAPDPPHWTLTS